MKYPSLPEKKEDRICVAWDYTPTHCDSTSCEKGFGDSCIPLPACFGDCSNCIKSPSWRGRCLCYKTRMDIDKRKKLKEVGQANGD